TKWALSEYFLIAVSQIPRYAFLSKTSTSLCLISCSLVKNCFSVVISKRVNAGCFKLSNHSLSQLHGNSHDLLLQNAFLHKLFSIARYLLIKSGLLLL